MTRLLLLLLMPIVTLPTMIATAAQSRRRDCHHTRDSNRTYETRFRALIFCDDLSKYGLPSGCTAPQRNT